MGQQLETLAQQLRSTLADQVTKPINELNDNLKIQAERALATLNQSEAFAESIVGCTKQDIEQLSGAATSSIRQFASDALPWIPDFPYISRVSAGGRSTVLGFRVGTSSTELTIQGSNLADPRCEAPSIQMEDAKGQKTSLNFVSSGPDNIVATLPGLKETGIFKISSQLTRRELGGLVAVTNLSQPLQLTSYQFLNSPLTTRLFQLARVRKQNLISLLVDLEGLIVAAIAGLVTFKRYLLRT